MLGYLGLSIGVPLVLIHGDKWSGSACFDSDGDIEITPTGIKPYINVSLQPCSSMRGGDFHNHHRPLFGARRGMSRAQCPVWLFWTAIDINVHFTIGKGFPVKPYRSPISMTPAQCLANCDRSLLWWPFVHRLWIRKAKTERVDCYRVRSADYLLWWEVSFEAIQLSTYINVYFSQVIISYIYLITYVLFSPLSIYIFIIISLTLPFPT